MSVQENKELEVRGVGRPRSITIDALLDAANEMGLHQVNMKALSARLGVGIATLYRYVQNRDELVRLAAMRQAVRRPPPDTGQPWQELMLGYAEAMYSVLSHNPQMMISFMEGGLGVELQAETLDSFVAALAVRGFDPSEALRIYRVMALIVMGAAAGTAHVNAIHAAGRTMDRNLRQALAQRDRDDLPHLRQVSVEYGQAGQLYDWAGALAHVIASVELQRGETQPG